MARLNLLLYPHSGKMSNFDHIQRKVQYIRIVARQPTTHRNKKRRNE